MGFIEDFFDFLYRNMHWILIGLLLILFWRTVSDNTFLILAIIAIIIGIMWDNWNKSRHMMVVTDVEEGFPGVARGRSPNHLRGYMTGSGYDAVYGHTSSCGMAGIAYPGACPMSLRPGTTVTPTSNVPMTLQPVGTCPKVLPPNCISCKDGLMACKLSS